MNENFCPGCGEGELRTVGHILGFGEGYESPCTRYDGESKLFLLKKFSHLSNEKMNAILEWYGYEPLRERHESR